MAAVADADAAAVAPADARELSRLRQGVEETEEPERCEMERAWTPSRRPPLTG